jgi:hypothetical protein
LKTWKFRDIQDREFPGQAAEGKPGTGKTGKVRDRNRQLKEPERISKTRTANVEHLRQYSVKQQPGYIIVCSG